MEWHVIKLGIGYHIEPVHTASRIVYDGDNVALIHPARDHRKSALEKRHPQKL